ncbi:MAG: HupE/UreJ family protein [Pseudomonadota bacterium]
MKPFFCISRLIALISMLGMPCAHAHDPGLSLAVLTLSDHRWFAQLNFARRDIELLTPIDLDHDGRVSAMEYGAARPELQALAEHALILRISGKRLEVQHSDVVIDQNDGLRFQLQFKRMNGSSILVSSPLLGQLSSGHRQFLSVKDQANNPVFETILHSHNLQTVVTPIPPALTETFISFITEGIWHIWVGMDHILFLLTLILPAVLKYHHHRWPSVDKLKPAMIDVLKIVTAFTLAHSITFSLAILEMINLPERWVESVIAFSVVIAALNNLQPLFSASRIWLAFGFGLIHGFGFANALTDLSLFKDTMASVLLGFNLGVEIGQLMIVMLVFPLAYSYRNTWFYPSLILKGGSLAAAIVASVWMVERIFDDKITTLFINPMT